MCSFKINKMQDFVCLKRKYYVDCNKFSAFKNALEFYRPVNVKGLIKKTLTFLSYPVFKTLRGKVEKGELFKEIGCESLIDLERKFGIFSGVYIPPGSGKIVAQVSDSSYEIKGYLKVAYSNYGKVYLENEVNILEFLRGNKVFEFAYPEVLDKFKIDDLLIVYLSTYKGIKKPFRVSFKDVVMLAEKIFSVEKRREKVAELSFVGGMARRMEKSDYKDLLSIFFEKTLAYLGEMEIETGLIHGDFKIWNVFFLPDGKPYIIDWEWSRRFGLPMWDVWTWIVLGNLSKGKGFDINAIPFLEGEREKMLFYLYLINLILVLEENGHEDMLTKKTIENLISELEKWRKSQTFF